VSLVSEALKKAERDAAARDARAKGAPAPFDAPLQPYRARGGGRRSRLLVSALALFGSAAAITIALLLFRPTGEEKAPVKGKTAEAPEALAVPAAPPGAAPATTAVSNPFANPKPGAPPSPSAALPDSSVAPGPAAAVSATMPSASESMAPPLATLPLPKTTLKPSLSPPSVSAPAAANPAALPAAPAKGVSQGSGDYLRSVEFADGSRLELGGIVYSEAAPFAYLNGRLVGVGEFVLGRRIDRIERDRVLLSGEGGEIILRLKTR
jgi:hypothetical protein